MLASADWQTFFPILPKLGEMLRVHHLELDRVSHLQWSVNLKGIIGKYLEGLVFEGQRRATLF